MQIIVPANSTKAEDMRVYVISTDTNSAPAPVTEDLVVNLSSSSLIDTPSQITINNGTHYASFTAQVKGSGKIYASAEGLKLGEQEISKIQNPVVVKVAIAPDVIMESSKAFFYVWLEKDGRPFKPPFVTEAYLSSSNTDVIRFSENKAITHYGDSVLTVSLIEGVASGALVSGLPGEVEVTANVRGFGSAETKIVVGTVLLDEDFELIEPENESETEERLREIEESVPNMAFSWFYPAVTDSKAYGVIALYSVNSTRTVTTEVDGNGTSIDFDDEIKRVVPVPLDGRTVSITSEAGLEYPNVLSLTETNIVAQERGIGFTHAIEFSVNAINEGNYTLSVSGPGLDRFQSNLDVTSAFTESYNVNIKPIPALPGQKQDLAMVSILDNTEALTDVREIFGGTVNVDVSTTDIEGPNKIRISGTNTAVYSGKVDESAGLVASVSGIEPHEINIEPPGVAVTIDLEVPETAHVYEKIPYIIHEIDAFGIPLEKIDISSMSASPGITTDGNYIYAENEGLGKITVLTEVGADSESLETFANDMTLVIVPSSESSTTRVGNELELKIASDINDLEVVIDSPLPYEKIDDVTYVITPNKEGYFNITFTGIKEGYKSTTHTYPIFAEKIVNLIVKAFGTDGEELNVPNTISIGNISNSIVTPYNQEIKPEFVIGELPETYEIQNKGYVLKQVAYADEIIADRKINTYANADTEIVAEYERMVKIDIPGAEGRGFYPYGETVNLSVPPKEKVGFLVREVFDHWEGIPYDTQPVSFAATEDIKGQVVFRDDYNVLTGMLGAMMTGTLYFTVFKKKGINPTWYIQKIKEQLNFKIPSKKKKTKEKEDNKKQEEKKFGLRELFFPNKNKKKFSFKDSKNDENKASNDASNVDF